MPRVHFVKKAAKDNEAAGIKAGDSYYWWANRHPGRKSGYKRFSKTPPRPSQTTGSPFLSQVYAIQEAMQDASPGCFSDLQSLVEGWVEEIRGLQEETSEKLQNMPDSLQQSPTGELLQERVDALDQWADELENVDIPDDSDSADDESDLEQEEEESDEDFAERVANEKMEKDGERLEEIMAEVRNVESGV